MTLRDLTDEQIKAIQDESPKRHRAYLKRRREQRLKTPTQHELWKQAFSDGAKASLEQITKP